MEAEPILTIICLAYNEVNYIKKCIEGVLMQQTSYAYEFIIHDDASTDGTTEIIREYAAKYPQITALYEEENSYSRGISPLPDILAAARGKYIAYCDGDDYWTDPAKLQQQIAFLEAHPDYGAVYTNYTNYIAETGEMADASSRFLGYSGRVYEEMLTQRLQIKLSTFLYRKMPPLNVEDKEISHLDYFRFLAIASQSKIHYLPEKMVVYTLRGDSMCHQMDAVKRAQLDYVLARIITYWLKHGPGVSTKTYQEAMVCVAKRTILYAIYTSDRPLYLNTEFPLNTVKNTKDFVIWILWRMGRLKICYPIVQWMIKQWRHRLFRQSLKSIK